MCYIEIKLVKVEGEERSKKEGKTGEREEFVMAQAAHKELGKRQREEEK